MVKQHFDDLHYTIIEFCIIADRENTFVRNRLVCRNTLRHAAWRRIGTCMGHLHRGQDGVKTKRHHYHAAAQHH